VWDLKTCKLITTVDWDSTLKTSTEPVFLYAAQFSKIDGTLILAGGSNSNEAKLFDRTDIEKAVVSIYDLAREVNTVDFGNKGNQFAVSGGDGYVRLFSMNINA
jgi:WD40 repeat protein